MNGGKGNRQIERAKEEAQVRDLMSIGRDRFGESCRQVRMFEEPVLHMLKLESRGSASRTMGCKHGRPKNILV